MWAFRSVALEHRLQVELRSCRSVCHYVDGQAERDVVRLRDEEPVRTCCHPDACYAMFVGDDPVWVHDQTRSAQGSLSSLVNRFDRHQILRMTDNPDSKIWQRSPVCIIKTTEVRIIAFDEVTADYAWDGGGRSMSRELARDLLGVYRAGVPTDWLGAEHQSAARDGAIPSGLRGAPPVGGRPVSRRLTAFAAHRE